MKECKKCYCVKEETDFYKKGNRIHSYCKSCYNQYCQERWIEKKKKAISYLGGCCKKCGYKKYYGALEFHHRDPSEKEFDWNKMRMISEEKMLNELDKCDLLCSNCHREEHRG